MFIGHFAVGFAAKRWAPRSGLAVLMLAPLLADVIWPVLVLAGVERARSVPGLTAMSPLALDDFPWSHRLAMDLVWAALLGWLVSLLALSYAVGPFMATPASMRPVVVSGLIFEAVALGWVWWLDRHRHAVALPHGPVL